MLSILIPIYNRDSTGLVKELHRQGLAAGLDFEIICLDDASLEEFRAANAEIQSLPRVQWERLDENIGRARIRNRLAEKAKYETLLFIDCDMAVPSDDFLIAYVKAMEGAGAVVGGVGYDEEIPANPEYMLRWTYGRERESNGLKRRCKYPYASFMTGVFLIDKDSFDSIKFDESILHYGHEDTLFGAELNARGIRVKHIDNPLIHCGLENNADFISKTEVAIETLVDLVQAGKMNNHVRLYRVYKTLKKLHLHNVFARRFRNRKSAWLENLYSKNPDLKYFDMYRLGYLCTLMKRSATNHQAAF
ncbi:MAG: glycosyltransferase [Flavobacteriales bacterium]|nr:glycosyltransferase [Flavobacteriales bacterium]